MFYCIAILPNNYLFSKHLCNFLVSHSAVNIYIFFPLEVKKNKQSVYLLSGKKRGGNSIQEQQPNKNPDQIIQESLYQLRGSHISVFCHWDT